MHYFIIYIFYLTHFQESEQSGEGAILLNEEHFQLEFYVLRKLTE